MSMIYHIEVGGKDFTPTDDQLKEVVTEFLTKDMPAFGHPVRINEVFIGDVLGTHKERLVIEAGDKDWQPTREELDNLVELFKAASLKEGSVVATRRGVRLHTVNAFPIKTESNDCSTAEILE